MRRMFSGCMTEGRINAIPHYTRTCIHMPITVLALRGRATEGTAQALLSARTCAYSAAHIAGRPCWPSQPALLCTHCPCRRWGPLTSFTWSAPHPSQHTWPRDPGQSRRGWAGRWGLRAQCALTSQWAGGGGASWGSDTAPTWRGPSPAGTGPRDHDCAQLNPSNPEALDWRYRARPVCPKGTRTARGHDWLQLS